ncbi:hypothetical protein GALL_525220 [mine drainage metagenome]|uniref:Uncharacterized protein n=1 Tax=mine drainage metagenome TaxID=410659 RepID=A0A1J5PKU9_9ZZZZ
MFAVSTASFFKHISQSCLFLPLLCGTCPILRGGIVLRHLHAQLLGQILHGFNETHAGMLHKKADGVAIFATAKTVIELFGGTH